MPHLKLGTQQEKNFLIASAAASVIIFAAILLLGDFPKIDTQFYVNETQAYEIIGSLTEKQISLYKTMLILDIAFPIAYSSCFFLLIRFFYIHKVNKKGIANKAAVFPIAAFIFDIGENICILRLINKFPKECFNANFVGYFSAIKWTSVALSIAFILAGLLLYIIKKSGLFGE